MTLEPDCPKDLVRQVHETLDALTAFQLYQLRHDIDLMLSDPDRVRSIRSQIREGDQVEYFDTDKNRCVPALVESCHRTRADVKNQDDGAHWRIEYVAINLDGEETRLTKASTGELTRAEVAVGDVVGFTDKHNHDCIGKIVKLNPKTAGILCEDGTRWRVSYHFLFSIIEADGCVKPEFQQRLMLENPSA